ncbi:MAG: peptidylprolyl isomerase [Thermomicrobiales bacterium]
MSESNPERTIVVIETTAGAITVEIDEAAAPITATNFLDYVDAGAYDGGRFHRTVTMRNQPDNAVKIEVIQAGPNAAHPLVDGAVIPLERTSVTGLRHLGGTISMGRDSPDSALSEIFFCIGDQPELDFGGRRNPDGQGFAAFGRALAGHDVIRAIQQSPHDGQTLTPAIAIQRIARNR